MGRACRPAQRRRLLLCVFSLFLCVPLCLLTAARSIRYGNWNPAPLVHPNGSIFLLDHAGQIGWKHGEAIITADSWRGPYRLVVSDSDPGRWKGTTENAEDPCVPAHSYTVSTVSLAIARRYHYVTRPHNYRSQMDLSTLQCGYGRIFHASREICRECCCEHSIGLCGSINAGTGINCTKVCPCRALMRGALMESLGQTLVAPMGNTLSTDVSISRAPTKLPTAPSLT